MTTSGRGGLGRRLLPAITEQAVKDTSDAFVEAWNRGDLETACQCYTEHAIFITEKGKTRGRQNILKRYQDSYPDRSAMGALFLELVSFSGAHHLGQPAIATFRWTLANEKDASTGVAFEIYDWEEGKVRICFDSSV